VKRKGSSDAEIEMMILIVLLFIGITVVNFLDVILMAVKFIAVVVLAGGALGILYLEYRTDIDLEEVL